MNFRLQNLSGDPTVDDPLMIRKLQWRWNERINFAHTWHDRLAFRRKQPVCNATMRPTKTWANSIARRSFNFWPVHPYSFFLPSRKIFSFFLWEGAGFGEWASTSARSSNIVFNIGAMGAVLVKEAGCEGLQGRMGSTRPSLLDEGWCHGVLEEVWLWCLSGFGVRKEFDSRKFVFSNYNWTSFLLDGIETSQLFWKSFPTTRRWRDLQPGATNWKRNLDERFSNRCL